MIKIISFLIFIIENLSLHKKYITVTRVLTILSKILLQIYLLIVMIRKNAFHINFVILLSHKG